MPTASRAKPLALAALVTRAQASVDPASLAVARIAFGSVVVLSAVRTVAYGWTDSLYAGPTHRFTYLGLGWVPQPGPLLIRVLVLATAAAGLALIAGWRTRTAALALLLTFGWIEAIDATTYLNHYWFVTLLAVLGLVVPWDGALAIGRRPRTIAAGWVWLLRFQVGIVYTSAGIAKLQPDWLRGLPLRLWLPARADLPLVGPLLERPGTATALAVAGAAFDLAVVPLLLWRRTRVAAWFAALAFHLATWRLFPIGVFPWLMVAMATVFFDPSWPRQVLGRWSPHLALAPSAPRDQRPAWRTAAVGIAAAAWVLVQIALPLRHLAYPGDHRWTAEGYRFGWNVLLVERVAAVTFRVTEPSTGRTWTADPTALYTPTQLRAMSGEPDLIHQAALAIAAEERARGREVEVRVDAWLSFNGRPAARWIDPTVDLAAEPRTLWHRRWLLPPP